jgi:carbonic anhydrase
MQDFFSHTPANTGFWHYEGGLTTPGCAQIVNWYLSRNIIHVNPKQLEKMKSLWVTGDGPVTGKDAIGLDVILEGSWGRDYNRGEGD